MIRLVGGHIVFVKFLENVYPNTYKEYINGIPICSNEILYKINQLIHPFGQIFIF